MNSYTFSIYRKDRRCKSGEKLVQRARYVDISDIELADKIEAWYTSFPEPKFRIEWHPATKIVKNLMTGKDVVIPWDCPRECDPSSELYWTM